jgi:hypothetical protein
MTPEPGVLRRHYRPGIQERMRAFSATIRWPFLLVGEGRWRRAELTAGWLVPPDPGDEY